MAQPVDIGNLQLNPGDFLEFEYLEMGTPTAVQMAVHAVKAALANDARWNYQGSFESERADVETGATFKYVTIIVQIRKPTAQTVPSLAGGIVPVIAIGGYILFGVVAGYVAAALIPWKSAVKLVSETAKDGNGQIRAIVQDQTIPDDMKKVAIAAIQANVEQTQVVASKPLIGFGGGMTTGLLLAVGGIFLFLFLTGSFKRGA